MEKDLITTIIVAVFASTGFWAFLTAVLNKILDKKNAKTQMLLGLGHDRIKNLAEHYIAQGWISSDDFEDLEKYLYTPYRKMGGNGTAEKLMDDVRKLPIKKKVATKS